jgi:hypothetical protein
VSTPHRRLRIRNPEQPIWQRAAGHNWSEADERELELYRLRELASRVDPDRAQEFWRNS